MKTLIEAPGVSLSEPLTPTVARTATAPFPERLPAPSDRRQLVRTVPNPGPGADYIVLFEIETTPSFSLGPLKFVARYVPDKLLLDPACLADYLHALTQPEWPTLEAVALAMRDDFGNEVIPRWIEIVVSPSDTNLEAARHSVLVEDRQPQWNNPNLLARLSGC